ENHTDPAGDPTAMTYQVSRADGIDGWTSGPFTLDDVAWYESFGQPGGVPPNPPIPYVVQATLPAGWKVTDIECLGMGRGPGEFNIDIPNGRVTMNHVDKDEQTCAFTNSRVSGSSGSGSAGAGTGITPTLPPSQLAKVALPNRPALLRVTTGR